jgi:hypothetical protein
MLNWHGAELFLISKEFCLTGGRFSGSQQEPPAQLNGKFGSFAGGARRERQC